MFNLRYHIASLTAVFVALAIGLVLGGLVARQGGFDSSQRALVTSLQKEYASIKKRDGSLTSSLSLENAYGTQMTDAWAAGRLSGRTVVVVTSGAKDDGADAAVSAIKSAGGAVVKVTLVKAELGLDDSQIASAAVSVLGTSSTTPLIADVANGLVAEWNGTASSHDLTNALVSAGSLTIDGLTPSTVATLAVDLAANSHNPDTAGLDIASAYAAAGMFALGAETITSNSGVAAAASARKLSAFDTLGTNAGRYTLVALFSGGQQGFYSKSARGVSRFPGLPDSAPEPAPAP